MISPEYIIMVVLFSDQAGATIIQASEKPCVLSTQIYAAGISGGLLTKDNPQQGDE